MDELVKNKKSRNSGSLTIELMIALAIMVLILSAVVMVSFTNQNFLIDSQTNAEALKIAQGLIEEQQALARKDFNLVNPVPLSYEDTLDSDDCPSDFIVDDIYRKRVCVVTDPENKGEYFNKLVTAIVEIDNGRNVKPIKLSAAITNFNNAIGGNTCDSVLSGNWKNPKIINEDNSDFAKLIGDPTGIYTLSDVDAYRYYDAVNEKYESRLYVTATKATNENGEDANLSTLFIFDTTNKKNPDLLGHIDSAPNTPFGLNAIHVSEDPASDPPRTYAYTANAYECDPTSASLACDGQLYIFDVTDPDNITISAKLKIDSLKPGISSAIRGVTSGASIFYKNGYIFLGLTKNDGPEFHILDVHKTSSITDNLAYSSLGSYEVGSEVNAIYVKNNYAYIASPDDLELKILDISTLSDPDDGSSGGSSYGFNSSEGAGHGKSIYIVGDKLYLGKTVPNIGNDFHILDNRNPKSVLSELTAPGSTNMPSSVNSIIVRSNLGFFLTNSDLEIFDIGDPTNMDPVTISAPLETVEIPTGGSPSAEPSMDCEGNYFYITSNTKEIDPDTGLEKEKGYLSIITSTP
jgi:type II secretory pathway pseudopilin PulG